MSYDGKSKKYPKFDPDSLPSSEQNVRAASARKLTFSQGCYQDEDGSMVRDAFGQRF